MPQIYLKEVSFSYIRSEPVFDRVTMQIDSEWKLGLIGRNGKGKTTLLKMLTGELEYSGSIETTLTFDYFPVNIDNTDGSSLEVVRNLIAPFTQWEKEMQELLDDGSIDALSRFSEINELYTANDGYEIEQLLEKELSKLDVPKEVLNRPFHSLSSGEKLKLQLAGLFLKRNHFVLFDEPFSHLDAEGRKKTAQYLKNKKGFILVSHERDMLDEVVDHVLSINRSSIEIQKGNYSTWQRNKEYRDGFEQDENEKLGKEINKMQIAVRQTSQWSEKVEKTKIGHGRVPDRGYIGHKSAKMMARSKAIEKRQTKAIEEKSALLKDIDKNVEIVLKPLEYVKNQLIYAEDLSISYAEKIVCEHISFSVQKGDRIALTGKNGSGKSSILKLLMGEDITYSGTLRIGSNMIISTVPQDIKFFYKSLREYAQSEKTDESLLKSTLTKLDFDRTLFDHDMDKLSDGQKKKITVANSLSQQAHLYVWDEPLNGIDILSRIQIEELLLEYEPTLLFVEHDSRFCERIATKTVNISYFDPV